MVIPSLPPGDSITLSFVFSASKSPISKIQDLFLSAKSKECIAKPLDRTKAISGDRVSAALGALMAVIGASFITYILSQQTSERFRSRNELLSAEEILKLKKESSELARLQVQVRTQSLREGKERFNVILKMCLITRSRDSLDCTFRHGLKARTLARRLT